MADRGVFPSIIPRVQHYDAHLALF